MDDERNKLEPTVNNFAETKSLIFKVHPQLVFEAERVRNKPDDETFELYSSLCKLGQKDHPLPHDELQVQKENWEQQVKRRKEKGSPLVFDYMDFSDLDLKGFDLSDIGFAGANFEGTDLSECNLDKSRFMFANLENANLDYTHADGALFIHSVLKNSSFNHASMNGFYFFSDLSGAIARNYIPNPQGFYGVKTEGASLEVFNDGWTKPNVKWQIVPVSDQGLNPEDQEILKKIDTQIEQDQMHLKQVEGRELDNQTRELYEELRRIGGLKKEKDYDYQIAQQKLEWLYKKNILGRDFNFDGLDLSHLDLSFLDLTGISFVGTNFEGSDVTWSNLSGVNCNLANFRDTTIIFSTLRGSSFFGADFTNANLTASRMRQTLYARVNFNNAKFEYTDFKSAVFMGTTLSGAKIQESDFLTAENLNKTQVAVKQ